MKMPALILTIAAANLLTPPASPQDSANPSPKESIQESSKKVKQLQKERIATLKEMVDSITSNFQNGRATLAEVYEAKLLLLKAELDAAAKQSDRITLYEDFVGMMKKSEKVAQARFQSGRGTHSSLLKFKAIRLEAEIHLEQAKAKSPSQTGGIMEHHKIVVTSPTVKDVVITHKYVCQIHGQRYIKVRALQKGYLEEVPLKEGQAVKKDDVMFKVVPILYKTKWDAALAEAKLAELELKNIKSLADKNAVSKNEVALYEVKLAKAQATAKLAEVELDFTVVKAPFDGFVGRLYEQQGSLINERDILTTLCDNSSMWVYFNVPQTRFLEYMAGPASAKEGKVELVLGNGKFKQAGKIGAIEAQFNAGDGSIPFRADFPNPDRLLRHGMTGTVLIPQTLKNAIVIPQRATFEILGKRYVYVVDKHHVAHKREIVVQNELEDIFVINRGVGVDDRIVVEGIDQVRDGQKVE